MLSYTSRTGELEPDQTGRGVAEQEQISLEQMRARSLAYRHRWLDRTAAWSPVVVVHRKVDSHQSSQRTDL